MAKEIRLPFSNEVGYINQTAFPTGEIDITENGEYDVYQYAKANVNVEGGGSSDFSTAKVSVDTTDVDILGVIATSLIYFPDAEDGYNTTLPLPLSGYGEVLLYQNEGRLFQIVAFDTNEHPLNNVTFTFSGDAEWDSENEELIVTGDFTIHVEIEK